MSDDRPPTREQIIDALRKVQDPELHQDIVSLDMVKQVTVSGTSVSVSVELTTPACPLKDQIRSDIETALHGVEGLQRIEVEFGARVRAASPHQHGDPLSQVSLPDVRNVVAIGAGKGGVGKSTLSVLAAVGLARAGASVGLLDADVYGPSIPKMLGLESERPTMRADTGKIVPLVAHGLKVMSIGFLIEPDRPVIWRGPMVHGTIKQFLDQVDWGELDYLIVDLPPGTGDVPLTLAQSIPMTGSVVVCTPQAVALADAVRAARMYQHLNVDVLGIVENMSYFIAPDTGKEYDLFGKGGAANAAADLRVPFLGSIPINIAIRVSGDAGTPADIFTTDPQGLGQTVTRVVGNMAAQISIRNASQPAAPPLGVHP